MPRLPTTPRKQCNEEGCDRHARALGYCQKHYRRRAKSGLLPAPSTPRQLAQIKRYKEQERRKLEKAAAEARRLWMRVKGDDPDEVIEQKLAAAEAWIKHRSAMERRGVIVSDEYYTS